MSKNTRLNDRLHVIAMVRVVSLPAIFALNPMHLAYKTLPLCGFFLFLQILLRLRNNKHIIHPYNVRRMSSFHWQNLWLRSSLAAIKMICVLFSFKEKQQRKNDENRFLRFFNVESSRV